MEITLSFVFCLLSGFACFWLEEERRINYVHSTICIRYCNLRLFDVCTHQTRKVLKLYSLR